MKPLPNTPRREPIISWSQNFDTQGFYCTVSVPTSWLMETSHWKRRWRLWCWLTKLAWSLPNWKGPIKESNPSAILPAWAIEAGTFLDAVSAMRFPKGWEHVAEEADRIRKNRSASTLMNQMVNGMSYKMPGPWAPEESTSTPSETPRLERARNAWEAKFNAECEKHDATTLRAMKAERDLALALDHIEKDDKEIERLHNEIAVLRNIISE